jgi:hypothetical protein
MTADLLYGAPGRPGLRDVITVHRVEDDDGECQVEGRYLTAPVLQALGVEAEIAEELVAERDSAARYNDDDPDEIEVKIGAAISPDLGPGFLRWDGADGSTIMSIESEADLEQPRNRAHIRAVMEADLASATSLDEIVLKEWNDRAPWTSESPAEGLVAGAEGDA